MKKLAIICTHPIQYYAPFFKKLAEKKDVDLKVFYTWGASSINNIDKGFGREIEWDVPLLENYNYEFVNNVAEDKGTHHYNGISNPDLINRIKEFAPIAILVYGWAWKSHLMVLRHFRGKITIWFRGDSTLLDSKSLISKILRKLFLKWVYNKVDLAFYVGQKNKAYFLEFGLREDQLKFAPHAIDNQRFATDHILDRAQIRSEFMIGSEDILILFAGKLEQKKNPGLLLNAFAEIHNKRMHLLFVGNGLLERELKETVKAMNLTNVHFLEFQNQSKMPAIYQACDLFCLPSNGPGETWGLAINEAMACGKAVIASTKVGSAEDLVIDGKNGAIFKSNDKEDLISKLNSLCTNRENLTKLGCESAKIISNWTFDNQAIIVNNALQKL